MRDAACKTPARPLDATVIRRNADDL